MGTFGFSYIGLIYLLMLFIPNIIWAKNQPSDYDPGIENKFLLAMERSGQILCSAAMLCFSNTNPQVLDWWLIWFVLSVLLMLAYEGFWIRYFTGGHTMLDFYRPFLKVTYPGATLPCIAFLLLGIYGKLVWLIIASVILSIGHIGIHVQHYKKINS